MAMDPLSSIAKLASHLGGGHVRLDSQRVRIKAEKYRQLPDDLLKQECFRLLSGGGAKRNLAPHRNWLRRLLSALWGRRSDERVLELLALGVEAFRRFPADLPNGSYLYPQQIEAAVALTRPGSIQMDTGEGKTYALLPAALTLAARYPRVYVLCANRYLAERDARRTLRFWRFVGLSIGLAIEGNPESEQAWSAQIVYTTLPDFMFKRMRDQVAYDAPPNPITTGAALLVDEADAVLIDAAFQPYTLGAYVQASSFDWSHALEIAAKLDSKLHVLTDVNPLRANLTVEGEALLRDCLGADSIDETRYLAARQAVELAYVASRIVKEDVHYVCDGQSLNAVDPLTGRIDRNTFPVWLTPLAFIKGLPPPPPMLTVDKLWPTSLLDEFSHLAAMSGSVAEDAVEYLLSYRLWTYVIPPRFPRVGNIELDQTFLKAEDMFPKLGQCVAEATAAGRPVLVATQSIDEAERFYRDFCHDFGGAAAPELLTGKNDYEAATFFEHAGEAGKVTIATQLAGRGVDIRLTNEARAAGGMALFGLGHALTARHDRQLMGRVGRQGDPFSILFFNSFDDSFFTRFPANIEQLTPLFQTLGMGGTEGFQHRWIDRAIRNAQARYAKAEFNTRLHAWQLSTATSEGRARFFSWFEACGAVEDDDKECSRYFVESLLGHFVKFVVTPAVRNRQELSTERARQVIAQVARALMIDEEALNWLTVDDLVGLSSIDAASAVCDRLSAELSRVFAAARQERARVMRTSVTSFFSGTKPSRVRDSGITAQARALPELTSSVSAHAELPNEGEPTSINSDETDCGGPGAVGFTTEREERGLTVEHNSRSLLSRTPRRVAYAALRYLWAGYLEELDRLDFQVAQGGYAPINRYRLLRERAFRLQHQAESVISARVLTALLRAERPGQLDPLFVPLEQTVPSPSPQAASSAKSVEWPSGISDAPWAHFERPTRREDIINQFVDKYGDELVSRIFSEAQLKRLLLEFTQQSPLGSLSGPEGILGALHQWFAIARERGVGRAERQAQRRALRTFLIELKERNLIGTLPSLQDHAVATGRRLAANLSGLRVALPLLAIALLALVLFGLNHFSVGAAGAKLGALAGLADELLFGGALRTGGVSALIIGALAAGCSTATLVQPQVDLSDQMNALGRALFWVFLAAAVVRMRVFEMQAGVSLFLVLETCLVTLLVLLLGEIVRAWVVALHADTGLSLIPVWLAYTSVGVLVFDLSRSTAHPRALLATFAGAVALLYVWRFISRCEVKLLSRRPTLQTSTEGENVYTALEVHGDVGAGSHVLGALAGWSLIGAVPPQVWTQHSWQIPLAGFGLYFATTALLIHHQLGLRLSPERWQTQLNEMRQVFVEQEPWGSSLNEALLRVRAWLFRRELLLLLLLSAGFGYTVGRFLGGSGQIALQVGLFGLIGAVIFGSFSSEFAIELYRFALNQGTVMPVTFETSRLQDPSDQEGLVERLKRYAENRLFAAVSVIVVLLNTVDLMRSFTEWVIRLCRLH
jgi:preprotein translocase subunit SecA